MKYKKRDQAELQFSGFKAAKILKILLTKKTK